MRSILFRSNFVEANLALSNLIAANICEANFARAILIEANIALAQALGTTFTQAKLTGACIESWCINESTDLNELDCDFIYLKAYLNLEPSLNSLKDLRELNPQLIKQRRCPTSRNFQAGEFARLFKTDRSYSRLAVLEQTILRFEELLNSNFEGKENLFHQFLKENSSLLDFYGYIESKPRFHYPPGDLSWNGKHYLEPDFIIRYPGNRYKLVEIEKPGKQIATKQGHPTSQFTQASWQLGEWEHYIKNYPHLLKEKYPGIATHRSSMLVIGRRISSEYMELLSENFPHDEVLTYDDLLDKAKQAHTALVALSI